MACVAINQAFRTVLFGTAFILSVHSNHVAANDGLSAGRALHSLITSNHLLGAYLEGSCARYVSTTGANNLISVNKKAIEEIERGLTSQDKAEFNRLANSPNEKARMNQLVITYINETVASNSKEPGGVPFACGIAYGNVINAFSRARSNVIDALKVN